MAYGPGLLRYAQREPSYEKRVRNLVIWAETDDSWRNQEVWNGFIDEPPSLDELLASIDAGRGHNLWGALAARADSYVRFQ